MSASLYFRNKDGLVPVSRELNMANSNACSVIAALGFSPEFDSDTPYLIDEFIRSTQLFFLSDLPDLIDQGTETIEQMSGKTVFVIHYGRRPGYISEKVFLAAQMAVEAKAKGATYCYLA